MFYSIKEQLEDARRSGILDDKPSIFVEAVDAYRKEVEESKIDSTEGLFEKYILTPIDEMVFGGSNFIKWKKIGNEIKVPYRIKISHQNEPTTEYFILGGSSIRGISTIFANNEPGKEKLNASADLQKHYEEDKDLWTKYRGFCRVNLDDDTYYDDVEIHWSECPTKGAVELYLTGRMGPQMKRIRRNNNMKKGKEHETRSGTPCLLTNDGIDLSRSMNDIKESKVDLTGLDVEGMIIRSGKVVEIARTAKSLLEKNDHQGFLELMVASRDTLSDNDRRILLGTQVIPSRPINLLTESCMAESVLYA